jgi:hypothetical protein
MTSKKKNVCDRGSGESWGRKRAFDDGSGFTRKMNSEEIERRLERKSRHSRTVGIQASESKHLVPSTPRNDSFDIAE